MANVLTTPGVLTLDTAAVISATLPFRITQIVYTAPAAAVGAVTLKDGAGREIGTFRAPTSDSVVIPFGEDGKSFVGLEVASITAASNLTIYTA